METERAVLDSECFVEQEMLGESARSGHHGPDATDHPGLLPVRLKLAADVLSTFPDEALPGCAYSASVLFKALYRPLRQG